MMKCILQLQIRSAIVIAVFFISGSWLNAHGSECVQLIHQLFNAPVKKEMKIEPEKLWAEEGMIVRYRKNHDTGISEKISYPVIRLMPDPDTAIGRIAMRLERMDTALFINPNHFEKPGASGYFTKLIDFRSDQASHFGKSIVLPGGEIDPFEFQITLMHEAFHAYGEKLREQGISFRHNSWMKAGPGASELLSPAPGYQKALHSEEIHAFTKDFINTSVIAHNRETVQLIESELKKMPAEWSRPDRLSKIHLSYGSVISQKSYDQHFSQLNKILESHSENLKAIEIEVLKYIRNNGHNKTLLIQEPRKGGIALSTSEVTLVLRDVTHGESVSNLKIALKKIRTLKMIDRFLKKDLQGIDELITRAKLNGHFTAEQYYELKNRMGKLSSRIIIRGVDQ